MHAIPSLVFCLRFSVLVHSFYVSLFPSLFDSLLFPSHFSYIPYGLLLPLLFSSLISPSFSASLLCSLFSYPLSPLLFTVIFPLLVCLQHVAKIPPHDRQLAASTLPTHHPANRQHTTQHTAQHTARHLAKPCPCRKQVRDPKGTKKRLRWRQYRDALGLCNFSLWGPIRQASVIQYGEYSTVQHSTRMAQHSAIQRGRRKAAQAPITIPSVARECIACTVRRAK